MIRLTQRLLKNKKGAAMVEYALLVAGVALIGAASVSVFGHKTNDMIAMTAAILPGAHLDDNNAMLSGKIIETSVNDAGANTGIGLDVTTILANKGKDRLDLNTGASDGTTDSTLVLEAK
jgi:Flp pilus assembly pilin Flp